MNQPLAPYAAIDEQSRGRRHPEPPPRFRSEFQRDRDRIIHSNAFRRLVYKTQVFVNHEGDLYRTRITHSLEVAQVGRTVARALRINETLTEAICLAHDLGHTPFGHAGQDALNVVLPQPKSVRMTSRKIADVQLNPAERRNLSHLPLREEAIGDSTLIEHLDRA
jgi:dGTPase